MNANYYEKCIKVLHEIWSNPIYVSNPYLCKGGAGSGNFNHEGRPGNVGGSGGGGLLDKDTSTLNDLFNAVSEASTLNYDKGNYDYLGVRFENMDRTEGDILGNSKDNPDREDERDFPDYNSEEYENLPEQNGTSAWDISNADNVTIFKQDNSVKYGDKNNTKIGDVMVSDHCYIIGSNDIGTRDTPLDSNEIILQSPAVISKLY